MKTFARAADHRSSGEATRLWGMDGPSAEEIQAAFSDRPELMRPLARWLLSVVDRKVVYVLRPIAQQKRRDLATVRQDLVHDVLLELLRDGGKILRQWDPARGCSLSSFIGIVSRCFIHHRFKRFKGNPWASELLSAEELMVMVDDGVSMRSTLAEDLEHRQHLEHLYQILNTKLSPSDRIRFDRVYVQQMSPAEVAREEGVSENAIHQWSSRTIRKIRDLFGETGGWRQSKHA
ncbi:MAG: sigma-70 family RNA polymerase sigma factor [Nannocystis sp.]|nr:sigma-70 family RNA polymerase sigma factor [Nannocystis sp.]